MNDFSNSSFLHQITTFLRGRIAIVQSSRKTLFLIRRQLFVLATLLLLSQSSFAQSNVNDYAVEELFEKPQKIQWIKYYKGRLDDLNDIAITLAYDGKQCKGQLTFLRSKEQFDLVGQFKKGKLSLQEFDLNARLSGYVNGEIDVRGITADWSNFDNSFGGKMRLYEVKSPVTIPGYCGDNKWIRAYKGLVGKDKVELIIQKESNQRVSGTAYFKSKNESYNVRGHIDIFDNVYLTLKDDHAKKQGQMEGTFGERQKFNLIFIHPDGQQNVCTFQLKDKLSVGCLEYADYISNYNVLYPKTKNAAFNKWIKSITDKWVSSCKTFVKEKYPHKGVLKPEVRASVRASAWSEIDYISEDIISGLMTFNDNWSTYQVNRSISYDLKNERAISLMDIFKSDFDYRNHLRNQLNMEISKHQLYKDFEYREWLAKEDFPYFTIRKEGIRFCTKFHPIYGQQQMTISYQQLKPFLKDKSVIKELID